MTQNNLFNEDGTPSPEARPADPSADCSAEALEKVDVQVLRDVVLEEYRNRPAGATADEILDAVKWRVPGPVDQFSIRPRVSELKDAGELVATGERRKNRKGNSCAVLVWKTFWNSDAFFKGTK